MLRLVVLVEDEGAVRLARSVVVFRADDWQVAKQRAVEVGRSLERTYVGGAGKEVRWRLQEIETLDELGDSLEDGREVYSEPVELNGAAPPAFDAVFEPVQSQPGQSGV